MVIAIASLGIAIGLNTTIYSLLDALIDPVVGVQRPDELYRIRYFGDVRHRLPRGAIDSALASGLHGYEGVTGEQRLLASDRRAAVEAGDHIAMIDALVVRGNFFSLLGTHAVGGRVFAPSDESFGTPLVVLSDRLAAALFPDGKSPIGASVAIEGKSYGVIGTVHRYQQFPSLDTDAWILAAGESAARVPITFIRLREGGTPASVNHELAVLAARLAIAADESPGDTRFYLPGKAERQFALGPIHYALIGAVVVILLVACGNLATLQFARGLTRGPELALRVALGAERRDVVTTLVLENALLAIGGLVLGLVLTLWGVELIRATIPVESAGYIVAPQVSWRTFAVASATTMVSLLLVGLIPAFSIARVDPNTLLKKRAGTGAHRPHRRRYAMLIALQFSVGIPLLSGGALLLRSARRYADASFALKLWFGYNPHPLVVASGLVAGVGGGVTDIRNVARRLVDRVVTARGVRIAAASASMTPTDQTLTLEEPDGIRREVPVPAWSYTLVSPSYLKTYGRVMLFGSDFADGEYDAPTVILEAQMAKYLWPGVNPVGRLIKFGDEKSPGAWARVVGVVKDARDSALIADIDPYYGRHPAGVYRVFSAQDTMRVSARSIAMQVTARAVDDPDRAAVEIRHALTGASEIESPYVATFDERNGTRQRKAQADFMAMLFSVFSIVALGLAAVGVYGIVSHSVSERRQEFGVRISLGATTRHVILEVLRDGKLLALVGIAVGLQLTRGSVGWIAMFLTGRWDLNDAGLFALIAGVLAVTAIAAAIGPAWRAARISPVEAMRSE